MVKFLSFSLIYNVRTRFERVFMLTGLSAFAMVLGFLQQLAVVRLHGKQPVTDFYFVLIVIPQITVGLAGSVIGGVLLPLMVRWRTQKGGEAEGQLARVCTKKIALFGVLFAVLCFLIGFWQLAKFQGSADEIWQAKIILFVCPFLTWGGVMATWFTTLAQSRNNYIAASFSMLCPAASGLALGCLFFSSGPWIFALGQVVGTAIQLLWLYPSLKILSVKNSSNLSNDETGALVRKLFTFVIMGAGFQLLPLIERIYAHNLESGAVASIALANRLGGALPPLLLSGFSVIMFTKSAELAASGNVENVVTRMINVVSGFHLLFSIMVLFGPLCVNYIIPHIVGNLKTAALIGAVLPDYFMAGSLAATGVIIGNSCNVVFEDYRLQIVAVYASLLVYFMCLYYSGVMHCFDVRAISFSYVIYFLTSMPVIVFFLAFNRCLVKFWLYAVSLGLLIGSWILARNL